MFGYFQAIANRTDNALSPEKNLVLENELPECAEAVSRDLRVLPCGMSQGQKKGMHTMGHDIQRCAWQQSAWFQLASRPSNALTNGADQCKKENGHEDEERKGSQALKTLQRGPEFSTLVSPGLEL